MPLTCSCDDGDSDEWWYQPADYTTLDTSQRKRCKSCGTLIDRGAIVARFERSRSTRDDVECAIYGDAGQIPLAAWYHCETCADLYFSLVELGYCVGPDESMRDLVREYAAIAAGRETW
jgi:hypothetical protein